MPCVLPLLYAAQTFEFSSLGFEVEATAIIRQAFDKACEDIHDEGNAIRPRRDPDRKPTFARSG
jgi:hypothetical protein